MKHFLEPIALIAMSAASVMAAMVIGTYADTQTKARGLANIRAGCAAVERMRVSTRVMDGEAWFGPIDHACWAKGSDRRWRQVDRIVGPDADFYPAGMRALYLSTGEQ